MSILTQTIYSHFTAVFISIEHVCKDDVRAGNDIISSTINMTSSCALELPDCILCCDWLADCTNSSPQRLPLELMNLRASAAVPYQTLAVAQLPSTLQHYPAVLKEHRSAFTMTSGSLACIPSSFRPGNEANVQWLLQL